MRRILTTCVALAIVAAACGDDGASATADIAQPATTAPTTSTSTSTTATATATATATTESSTTTTAPLQGMCGDLIPVVTDDGTNCVDPDAPITTTPSPSELEWPGADFWQGTIPPLIVADGTEVSLLTYGEDSESYTVTAILTTAHPVMEIRQATDGTVFTQEFIEVDEYGETVVAIYRPGEPRQLFEDASQLYDLAVVDGVESVIVSISPENFSESGEVVARSVAAPTQLVSDFELYNEALYFVERVDVAADVLVYSAFADLTEEIGFRGNVAPRAYSPTDGLPYNAPPFVTGASLSADGSTIFWVEGNDYDPALNRDGGYSAEPWTLFGARVSTGEVTLQWPLTEPQAAYSEMRVETTTDLGHGILMNRVLSDGLDRTPLPAWVLDFTVEEPERRELPIAGVATPAAI